MLCYPLSDSLRDIGGGILGGGSSWRFASPAALSTSRLSSASRAVYPFILLLAGDVSHGCLEPAGYVQQNVHHFWVSLTAPLAALLKLEAPALRCCLLGGPPLR